MNEVTRILSAIEEGDAQAAAQLLPLVYNQLRNLAAQRLVRPRHPCEERERKGPGRFPPPNIPARRDPRPGSNDDVSVKKSRLIVEYRSYTPAGTSFRS
jgi:hypothetical protein